MSEYRKISCKSLNGLKVTVHPSCTMKDEDLERELHTGIMQMVMFDGKPIEHILRIEASRPDDMKGTKVPMCIVAADVYAYSVTAILLTANTGNLKEQLKLHEESPVYEKWEVDFTRAVLALAEEFDFVKSINICEAALHDTPANIFALRLAFVMYLLAADFEGMEATMTRLSEYYKEAGELAAFWPYVYQFAAYAKDECGKKAEAIQMTQVVAAAVMESRAAGVKVDGKLVTHASLAHTLMHIYEFEPEKALQELEKVNDLWVDTSLTGHIYWHRMLGYYDLGHIDKAFELYDESVRRFAPERTLDVFALCDCTAFLFRAYIEGNLDKKDPRIQRMYDEWTFQSKKEDCLIIRGLPRTAHIPFLDVHLRAIQYIAGDADDGTNRTAIKNAMQQDLNALSAVSKESALLKESSVQRDILVSFLFSTTAALEEDFAMAAKTFGSAKQKKQFRWMGGSNAQRELLERGLVHYITRAGSVCDPSVREPVLEETRHMAQHHPDQPYFTRAVAAMEAAANHGKL